ncbi:hypothetical protein EDC04DRAFT_2604024 [Pisolithus marmoratus]|nr:hypothetical protein EDC04DRAFT_2604024 [Pisolithus marmoratus]
MGLRDRFRVSKKTTILPKDVVVFNTESATSIVGPSGSGKSWLFSILLQISKTHVPVDREPKLDVTEVNAERCCFCGEDSEIVLVDTPSLCTFVGRSGEENLKEWLDSKYRKPCKAAGILYLHNIGSNPYDPYLMVSRYLGCLMPMYHQGLAPSAVHVIPTITPGAQLSTGRIGASMLLLKNQADDLGASMLRTPFDGNPETAWDVVQELLNNMKLGGSFMGGCSSEQMPLRYWGMTDFALEKNIALSRALLEDAPLGHPEHYLALVDLAEVLHQRFRREEDGKDLDEIITLRRATAEFTPSGHQERFLTITHLADCLVRRFWNKGIVGDLIEAIPLRRAALELAPSGHQEHRVSLDRLVQCLEQRLGNGDSMEDLTEIIALRRAVLKLTPPGHEERFASLAKLADCLVLQHFKSGGTLSDLEEIISLQRAALACKPLSSFDQAVCRASLTRCLSEKYRRQCAMPLAVDYTPPADSSPSICDPVFPIPTFLLLNQRNRLEISRANP